MGKDTAFRLVDPYTQAPSADLIRKLTAKYHDPTNTLAVVVDSILIIARVSELAHAKKIKKELTRYHTVMHNTKIRVDFVRLTPVT